MDTGATKKFAIANVALYAKAWYKRSGDVWADVIKCLKADDYEPNNRHDVLAIIMRHTVPLMGTDVLHYTQRLLEAIDPHTCWRYGFYTKNHTWALKNWPELANVEYDAHTAMLWFYLSWLQGEEVVKLGGKLPAADPNVLPLRKEEEINETV